MSENAQEEAGANALGDIIQQAKRQLEQMIDLNPESMVLVDAGGQVMRANRAFITLLGNVEFRDVLNHPLAEIFRDADAAFFARLLDGKGQVNTGEIQVRLGDGRQHLLRFSVLASGADEQRSLVVIAHDVTDEKQQSALLEKAYKVEAVRALMGALMHHMNQPLTVVMVRARLMQQTLDEGRATPEEMKATLEDIMELTMKVANMLKRVGDSKDFVTQEYVEGVDILKIDEP